ncbi:MAG: type II toxin-antitoxin system PemK/MazF family toxin [Phycisphaerales bacterium]|nr:type II toxin-antitoxin system PemK/MazF family toxin [Phycisphaerales bacterium]
MKCGQIILLEYPFTDGSGCKVRPALIVSSDVFNSREDFVAVPISAQEFPNDMNIFPLDAGADWFKQTGLRAQSKTIRWSILMTISQQVVKSTLGVMPSEQLQTVRSMIQRMFQ